MYAVIVFRTIAGHSLRGVQQCPQTVGGEERETAIEQEPAGCFEEQDQVRLGRAHCFAVSVTNICPLWARRLFCCLCDEENGW